MTIYSERVARMWSFAKFSTVVLLTFMGVGCNLGARSFEVHGQLLGIDRDRPEVLLKHEDVPGLMSAMTMPFRVQDARALEGLREGDLVTAHLIIRGTDAYLTRLERTGSAAIEPDLSAVTQARGLDLLRPGQPVPAAKFVDQAGRVRTFEMWRGQAAVVTFIYTRCPVPTFCPMMDRHFAAVQSAVNTNPQLQHQVHLVSITFDPQHDRPSVLAAHAKQLGADPAIWTFLTGDQTEIDRFATRFGVSVTRDGDAPGNLIHNLRTAIIDKRGNVARLYSGADWTPSQLIDDLIETIAAGS